MPRTCTSVSIKIINAWIIFVAGSLWGAVLLSSFLQGLSMQRPEESAFLSLFNTGMPIGINRDGALSAATALAVFDAVNQGVIASLSHLSRQMTHVTHREPLAGPGYAGIYAGLGLCMGLGSGMSAYNGLTQAIMDIGLAEGSIHIDDMEQKAKGFGMTIAILSGAATAYFAYSRGREIHDTPWCPTTPKNRAKFVATLILRNLGQLSLNFYQVQRATGSSIAGLVLAFLSVLGMDLTQMKAHGISIRESELRGGPLNMPMSPWSTCVYHYLKYSNWFNVLSAPAILRSNLSQIQIYRNYQDEPQVWIPTVVVGLIFGVSALSVSSSIRIAAIQKLLATSLVADFKEWIRPSLKIRGDALLCWHPGAINPEAEEQPLLPKN